MHTRRSTHGNYSWDDQSISFKTSVEEAVLCVDYATSEYSTAEAAASLSPFICLAICF